MKYHEAKMSIFRGRLLGGMLIALASVTCIISILKFLYYGFDAGSGVPHDVSALLRELVADIYRHTHFLNLFWRYAPLPDARHYLSEPNVFFALTYVIAIVGLVQCHYANALAQRVQEVEKVLAEAFHLHPISK